MSNLHDDDENLESEAKALSDAIRNIPDADSHEDEEESNVLMEQPKKKKPVLRMLVGVGGALVLAMGGLVVYSQYMDTPAPTVSPMPRKLPPLEPSVTPAAVLVAQVPSTGPDAPSSTSNANLPGAAPAAPAASNTTAAPATPFDKPASTAKDPFDTPKASAPVEVKAPEPELKTLAPEKSFTQSEKLVENKPAKKVVARKVAKKSAKKPQIKNPVLPLSNQQPVDNGYKELF